VTASPERPDPAATRVPEPAVTDAGRFLADVGGRLVGALTIRVGDRRIAEELAQEALARAWSDWARVSVMENPTGWVYRVGFNLAASHWRRAVARRRVERAGRTDEPALHLMTAEAIALRAAIAELSDQQQRVVILRYYAGLDVAATAEALGVSTGTVKTQTARAMARLRRSLGDRDG
jgi:RNA polymerase sigma factor (sigma-70 family)